MEEKGIIADLHVHTSVSDCSQTCETVLEKARQIGLTHIAFTDHDTTRCAKEHVALASKYGIQAVCATEMSAYDQETGKKVHILGYGYQTVEHIEAIGSKTLQKRNENCLKQIEILGQMGFHMDVESIYQIAGNHIYKQHILDYLVRTNQSKELFGDIYQSIFKNEGPCDFDIIYPEATEVVRAITKDGGYAVLAHPGQQDNFEILPRLCEAGLRGIERNHPANSIANRRKIDELCSQYQLFYTGGSDYHGAYERHPSKLGSDGLDNEAFLQVIQLFDSDLTHA